jgi:hypothetical protein
MEFVPVNVAFAPMFPVVVKVELVNNITSLVAFGTVPVHTHIKLT